jgi:hypothetical protein
MERERNAGATVPRGTNPDVVSLDPGYSPHPYSRCQTAQFLRSRDALLRAGLLSSATRLRRSFGESMREDDESYQRPEK